METPTRTETARFARSGLRSPSAWRYGLLIADAVDDIKRRAGILGTGCHWRSRGHDYCYRRWRATGVFLAVLAGAFSAAAGSALLATAQAGTTWRITAGVLGLMGAVFTAADRALGAQARSDAHRRAGSRFRTLRMQYYDLSALPPSDSEDARKRFEQIHEEHMRAENEAEPLEGWADDKATREWEKAKERKENA
jgi:hypothetical protein